MQRQRRPTNATTAVAVAPRSCRRQCALRTWVFLLIPVFTPPRAQSYSMAELPKCWTHCAANFSGIEKIPGTGCRLYQICFQGKVKQRVACGEGLLYNIDTGYCDYPWLVDCTEPTCPPTMSPSESPTESPSDSPTASPTKRPTASPTEVPTDSPSYTPTMSPTASEFAMPIIRKSQRLIEKYVLISYTSSGIAYPSIKYTFDYLVTALDRMAIQGFGADFQFLLGNEKKDEYIYGLVNLAAFLANAMVESIQYDSCDELNWQAVAGRYAISNSCGQQGRSYQNEECGEVYSCVVDTEMEVTAVDSSNAARAPPPFTCKPGTGDGNYSGYWDTTTGVEISDTPYSSTSGRTDVEGCCWWGRGALLTRNVCNIGKLNYYLGKRAAQDGRTSLYPNVDFCQYPEATCSSESSVAMIWTVAMFEWAERVQRYEDNKWKYDEKLIEFVDGGMSDDSFIMSVGRILANGCHEVGCSTIEVRMADQRKVNFYLIINDIFDIKSLKATPKPSSQQVEKVPPAPLSTSISSPFPLPVNGPSLIPSRAMSSKSDAELTYEPTYNATLYLLKESSAPVGSIFAFTCRVTLWISAFLPWL
eukprot:CCRYP_012107-RA/>CCRYP_012107-RA protein AED:0.04 eAED:0.04 QI:401/1/1/1/1/1/3/349/588